MTYRRWPCELESFRTLMIVLTILTSALFLACGNDDNPAKPKAPAIAAPSEFQAVAASSSQVGLSWKDNSGNETGFKVYRGMTSDDVSTLIATLGENAVAFSDIGLVANKTYHYKVCAFNEEDTSKYATASVTTPGTILLPWISLGQYAAGFEIPAGGGNPPPQMISVENGGQGLLSGLSAQVQYDSGSDWLSVSMGTTAPTSLSIQPLIAGLEAGTYTATVQVSSTIALNSPQNVGVTVTLTPGSRQLRITNDSQGDVPFKDVVQLKIVTHENQLSDDDLLSTDGYCWDLPQDHIRRGRSMTFDLNAPEYIVFIGLGRWLCEPDWCPAERCFNKKVFWMDTDLDLHWNWVALRVDSHVSGIWNLTVSGSYLAGNLVLELEGGVPIPFKDTLYNPIPGKALDGLPRVTVPVSREVVK